MKNYILYTMIICLLLLGCVKKYKFTTEICANKIYVEKFNVNPGGVDANYLTDSLNFKILIGTLDEEHERYIYQCKGDSIYIIKEQSGDKNCQWITLPDGRQTVHCDIDTIENKVYSLSELKRKKKFE